ncbi:CDP-alcohol phosphatidyltransferase family protein [Parasulfitobacter algicola]|uniref:CDP-alcohol phosphatidyltransferase family protein n=1 Tax=Parasulfitobacter algicola TaxID=2614809 RepID=A0ABX2ITT8_9RHOB|nr:CDP-alcohol phosphatidyltransferase family protein [Sulfitobacter algicola]NSX56337.1 CDP-alcohol phosphatidyltransferase family protein [Sulfitobacter algicola]
MLDAKARVIIDPVLNTLGRKLAMIGITANAVTIIGLFLGLLAAAFITVGWFALALVPLLLSRIADGLDGAIARATQKTDFGGYLDIAADFLFYGAIPMAFVWFDPAQNGAAGAYLLTSFYFNGTSFLGFAILAEKKKMVTKARGTKSLYFTGGLLEGTETIVFFVILCLFPTNFAILAWVFGTLCFITACSRIFLARKVFPNDVTMTQNQSEDLK